MRANAAPNSNNLTRHVSDFRATAELRTTTTATGETTTRMTLRKGDVIAATTIMETDMTIRTDTKATTTITINTCRGTTVITKETGVAIGNTTTTRHTATKAATKTGEPTVGGAETITAGTSTKTDRAGGDVAHTRQTMTAETKERMNREKETQDDERCSTQTWRVER